MADISNFTLRNPIIKTTKTGEKYSLSTTFNAIFEDVKGVDRKKKFSKVQATTRGRKRGRFNIFISPSAEDFQGLLLQMTGKGKKGKSHIKWFNDKLVKPYIEGTDRIDADKVKLMLDYKKLVNDIPGIKKYLKNDIYREDGTKSNLTNNHAVRVYLWEEVMGIDMVKEFGLSERDRDLLIAQVESDAELLSFAKRCMSIIPPPPISPKSDELVKSDESLNDMRGAGLNDCVDSVEISRFRMVE